MFKTDTDRLNYGEILKPPYGYTLNKAIGTTYALDLEALTAIAIATGLAEDTDSKLLQNPIAILNALQKISEKNDYIFRGRTNKTTKYKKSFVSASGKDGCTGCVTENERNELLSGVSPKDMAFGLCKRKRRTFLSVCCDEQEFDI